MIDLHARSVELLETLGPKASEEFDAKPPAGATGAAAKPDKTHLSPKGQQAFGQLVAEELKKVEPSLAAYIN